MSVAGKAPSPIASGDVSIGSGRKRVSQLLLENSMWKREQSYKADGVCRF
jgi:hypothetical protein